MRLFLLPLIIIIIILVIMIVIIVIMGCTQIPISTLSHIWVFVRLYGIVYVIIVIIITGPKPAYSRQGLVDSSLRASGAQLGSRK